MFVVDTNVLGYAADRAFAEHERCRALVERWRRQPTPWYTTWAIMYEFLRITTHSRVLREPLTLQAAWVFVEALLAAPGFGVLAHTERHAAVAAEVVGATPDLRGNVLHDAHTAVVMREHGIRRIYTRDTDFHRFPFVEVLDPLAAPRELG